MTSSLQVEGTNDSSSVSKLSCCRAGYWHDPFLPHFVSRESRRAPLIHWGYYIRHLAISHVINTFLSWYEGSWTQVICLGAGFDTTYFQLAFAGRVDRCRYFEVDLPRVVERKRRIVDTQPELSRLTSTTGGHYKLLACDIAQTRALEQLLGQGGACWDTPTLLLGEVVLTYIKPAGVDSLISWAAGRFLNAMFCSYEQVYPGDSFGQVMRKHFESLSSPLRNIESFPSPESISQRYKDLGWPLVATADMNSFFCQLPRHEWERVRHLEPFDEYEEWHLKCGHYVMMCAMMGECVALETPLNLSTRPGSKAPLDTVCRLPVSSRAVRDGCPVLRRYGHDSVMLLSGLILVYGGFGCQPTSGAHSRLDSLLLVGCDGEGREWVVESPLVQGDAPGQLMHSTLTLLADGSVLLLGGRSSPQRPNDLVYLLQKDGAQWRWEEKRIQGERHLGRWRHTSTAIGGGPLVLVVGGLGPRGKTMDDIVLLDTDSWRCNKLPVRMGVGCHSHSAVPCGHGVLVAGGLDADMNPLSCVTCIRSEEGKWSVNRILFNPPLPARYSTSLHCILDQWLLMVGGVQLSCSCTTGVVIGDLATGTWQEHGLQADAFTLLLHGCTTHWVPRKQELVLIGGGGNCFSFGTHLNHTPLVISLADALSRLNICCT